jgi:hypothetical protein
LPKFAGSTRAPANSSSEELHDPFWSEGIYAVNDPDKWVKPIEDLSEPKFA